MNKYIKLIEGRDVLSEENIWYSSDTSCIYKHDNLLYKISQKKEPNYRYKLDFLLNVTDLDDVGVLPKAKVKTDTNKYGLIMNYLPNTKTLWNCLKENKLTNEEMIQLMIIASDNLKKINAKKIKFPDLHHNNILITKNKMIPYYIDFDDAVIEEYSSCHISYMSYKLHELEAKDKSYISALIKNGNLDRENLFLIYFNYLYSTNLEDKGYPEYYRFLEEQAANLPSKLIEALAKLKTPHKEIPVFTDYLGDYLKEEKIKQKCIKERKKYE